MISCGNNCGFCHLYRVTSVQNIILDLGGVIINLDQGLTIETFNRQSRLPLNQLYQKAGQSSLFDAFDKGHIGQQEFFDRLREETGFSGTDRELLQAWNAMLLDVPSHRLNTLVELKQRYRTFLLSNTCEPHIEAFEAELYRHHGIRNFNDYFDQVYYSCRTGMRKPDPEIFNMVLERHGLDPQHTIFIDDSVQHVKGAGECGITAYLLEPGMELRDLLKQLRLL